MKKVLILCTGNSCRSIMAEAIINAKLNNVEAKSSGVKATKKVNPLAKKVLEEKKYWKDKYYSKTIDEVIDEEFDLVVTVCDNAKENCPIFPKPVEVIHVGFEDPTGKEYEEYIKTAELIEEKLLPIIESKLDLK